MKVKITCRPRYNPWLKKYLNSKAFSKMLALGVLINSVPINSFAGILSEDGRYETFEGSNITIPNILEEDTVGVEIEGNTLVNLVQFKDKQLYSVSGNNRIERVVDGNFCTYRTIENTSSYITVRTGSHEMIKPNTTYTICFTIKKNTIPNYNGFSIRTVSDAFFSGGNTSLYYNNDYLLTEGRHKVTITTNADISSYTGIGIGFKPIGGSCPENLEFIIGEIMVLEGDWTDREVPSYFEGMKSVGQNDKDGHKIEILSQNKNLFNGISNLDTYKLDINGELYSTTMYDGRYRVQIEKGITSTDIVKQPLNKKEIILNEPLRGLPNGIKDRIIKRNGQWFVEKNCGEVTLNGNEDWIKAEVANNGITTTSFYFYVPGSKKDYGYTKSDLLNTYSNDFHDNKELEGICLGFDTSALFIRIKTEKLSSIDTNGIKEWLSKNPVKVTYQLEKPIYEPINIDSVLNLYEGTTHISSNSTIPTNLKITVDRTINRAVEYTELAKTNPTINNLSKARYWNNLLKDSIKKDQLQEDVNNITTLNDMTFDRKMVSANLDLYIQCENILQMTLNTNLITFEDFSGIEDMVKENAVNISINSSLPYNLNAYLATDIQNSDKSNTMNKDILSIKDNSEIDYQTFTNTVNKIVLKSNCNSGNDKQHDINLKLNSGIAHEKDVYKATIKFEAEQQ